MRSYKTFLRRATGIRFYRRKPSTNTLFYAFTIGFLSLIMQFIWWCIVAFGWCIYGMCYLYYLMFKYAAKGFKKLANTIRDRENG